MASTAHTPVRKRMIHHLDTPFAILSWPEITAEDQDTILELLCDLLSPIGQHRRARESRSKGRRAKKRAPKDSEREPAPERTDLVDPAVSELKNCVDVGFNTVTNELQSISSGKEDPLDGVHKRKPYCMVFVARGNQSAAFNCHFPTMIAVASRKLGADEGIKLIGFSKPCSERLSACLGVARVSSLAIVKDAPGAEALWAFVQHRVAGVDSSWLDGTISPRYRLTQLASKETTVGSKKIKTGHT